MEKKYLFNFYTKDTHLPFGEKQEMTLTEALDYCDKYSLDYELVDNFEKTDEILDEIDEQWLEKD